MLLPHSMVFLVQAIEPKELIRLEFMEKLNSFQPQELDSLVSSNLDVIMQSSDYLQPFNQTKTMLLLQV